MNSRIREAICLKTQPVAVIQTDHLPPDAQGWETEHHGCILPRLEDAAEGKTVVVAEHRLAYLMDVVDRVVFMEEGRIAWDRSAAEVAALSDGEIESFGLRSPRPVSFCVRGAGSEMQGNAPALEIRDLSFSYPMGDRAGQSGGVHVDSLEIPKGSIVGVVGNNGAGKTTFSRCLCGLEKKAVGSVKIAGEDCSPKQRRRRCYLVMQDVNHQLFTESVIEEVLVGMRACGVGADEAERIERARAILESLDLLQFADVHPLALSGGQKQRVAIAGAIASEREIMVFDEPTSGLDLRHMLETAENLRGLSARGVTSLIVTHDPELINECCDWVVSLSDGEVAWSSPLDERCAARLARFFG